MPGDRALKRQGPPIVEKACPGPQAHECSVRNSARPATPLQRSASAELTVACACGTVFERWVTPEEADRDLVVMALRNWK
jgi:hypothetical protein